jgi:trigger factor
LKVETQFLENHQAKIVAELDAEALNTAKQRAARQLAKQAKIPGFRPGKAPYNVIERVIGGEAILDSAVELLLKENYAAIVEEAGVEPYGAGVLDEIASKEPPIFHFTVPLRPEATLGDYRSLRRPYELPTVSDDDVQNVIRNLQERQAIIEPVERPIAGGDQVTAKFSAQRTKVVDGQSAEIIAERSQPFDIAFEGDDTTNEWPFPAFSQNLLGMSAGDEKTFTYIYPEDYDYEALRQVEAEFHVAIEDVKTRTLPELNDEFAQSFGDFATIDDLKARIRENIEHQNQHEYDDAYTESLFDELAAQSTVKYPPKMLENEIDVMMDEITANLKQRGMDIETYLKSRQMDEQALRDEVRPSAEKRIQRSLLLIEISRQEDVKVDPNAVQMQAYQTMNQITQNLTGKDLRRANSKEFISNLVQNVTVEMYNQATVERLRAIAKGEIEAQELAATTAAIAAAETAQPVAPEPVEAEMPDSGSEAEPTTPAE